MLRKKVGKDIIKTESNQPIKINSNPISIPNSSQSAVKVEVNSLQVNK